MAKELLRFIDVERYPIDAPGSPAFSEVVAAGRRQLAASGAAELPGFLSADGVDAMVADARALATRAFSSGGLGTAYLELPDEALFDAEHPRRRWMPYSVGAVAYDLMPRSSLLRSFYEAEEVRLLIEAILDRGPLYRYGDPFGALNLAVMGAGDELQWHFDQTDFVVSLAIQAAASGGDFEVVPRTRSAADERYEVIEGILDGARDEVITLPMTPGTLLVFEGRNSLHRVTPISGDEPRLVGLLGYDTSEGTMSSELLRAVRYGRSEPFASPPVDWLGV